MVFDQKATMMTKDLLLKTLCWYDNGWGFASRILDVMHTPLWRINSESCN